MSNDKHERAARLRADGRTWNEVAEEIGVHRRTLYRWRNSGKVEDPQKNGTEAGSAVALEDTPEANGDGSSTLSEARRRKQDALAEKRELEVAQLRGELVTRGHVRDVIHRFRSAAEAAPRALLPEIAEIMDVDEREAHPVLLEIADKLIEHGRLSVERWAKEEAKQRGLEVEND